MKEEHEEWRRRNPELVCRLRRKERRSAQRLKTPPLVRCPQKAVTTSGEVRQCLGLEGHKLPHYFEFKAPEKKPWLSRIHSARLPP